MLTIDVFQSVWLLAGARVIGLLGTMIELTHIDKLDRVWKEGSSEEESSHLCFPFNNQQEVVWCRLVSMGW